MTKAFFTTLLLFGFMLGKAQQAENKAGHATTAAALPTVDGSMGLKETVFDFGSIPQGKPAYHVFEVKNNGTTPLKIENIHTSCGCTTPEWRKEPIAPGAITQVKVGFNAAAGGAFEKTITLQYNGTSTKQVTIKGVVWTAPEGAAPPNAAIQFLKQQIQ